MILKAARYIISYVVPYVIEQRKGEVTPDLEVCMVNGHYVLDTKNINYSYGGLHTLFLNVFKKFKLKERKFDNVLILGFGAGDVASILNDNYNKPCTITAIEKDNVVIELGKKYFRTDRFKNVNLLHGDAYRYVLKCKKKFDVIIIDVFVDKEVPPCFESKAFIEGLNKILSGQGILFYNKIVESPIMKQEANKYKDKFSQAIGDPKICIMPSVKMRNWVFVYDRNNPIS